MHVKGGLIRARFLFIVMNHGAATWNDILAELPQEDRAALSALIIDNWYSLAALDRLDQAIAVRLGGDPDEIFAKLDCVSEVCRTTYAKAHGRRRIVFDGQQPTGFAQSLVRRLAKILIRVVNHRRLRQKTVNVRIQKTRVWTRQARSGGELVTP